MKKDKISEILENINTKYVDEATLYTGKSKKIRLSVLKWGAAAACLSLALAAAFAIPKLNRFAPDNKEYSSEGGKETAYAGGEEIAGADSGDKSVLGGAYIGDVSDPISEDVGISSEKPDYPAMIMVDGKLYKAAGSAFMSSAEIEPDGWIVSSCDNVPTENDQSNFGAGYAYQIGENGTVNVRMEDGWHVFLPHITADAHGEPSVADAPSVTEQA